MTRPAGFPLTLSWLRARFGKPLRGPAQDSPSGPPGAPSDPAATLNAQGAALLTAQQPDEAEPLFRRALELDPSVNVARSNLGQALRLLGRPAEALNVLQQAVTVDPDDELIRNRLGTVLRQLGRPAEAEVHFRAALRRNPRDADVLNNLGAVMNEQGLLQEAEQQFRAAIASAPDHAMAQCNLGLTLADLGRQNEAEQYFLGAVAADPSYFHARISYVMNKLPIIHDDIAEGELAWGAYRQALEDLSDWLPMDDPAVVAAAAETVGWVSPFYLAYLGHNDRELQAIYGRLLCEVMARRYPEFATPPAMPAAGDGRPLRVGIVSAYFFDHSNWKMPICGWVEQLDHSRFQVFGYYTGFHDDDATQAARQACERFVEGMAFEALARKIRDDALHVLIFPEIFMDPVTVKLATLKLAPIQCNSWGHPDTSGMPTIDYYLGSDLMEPEDGQAHYTERLVRLPNIGIHYTPPSYVSAPFTRADLGLREDAVLYCCAQSLFKYLPQFDHIFVDIAARVDNAQFVFFSSQKSAGVTEKFLHRVAGAFASAGLDAVRLVIVMPRLKRAEFQAAVTNCDIFLDSVEWAGCNTSLEALASDVPVITCRGSMMRGRHTYSFLKMMGMDALIADDVDAYVDLAVALGTDGSRRAAVRTEIRERFPLVCRDMTAIRALENFLVDAVAAAH